MKGLSPDRTHLDRRISRIIDNSCPKANEVEVQLLSSYLFVEMLKHLLNIIWPLRSEFRLLFRSFRSSMLCSRSFSVSH